MQGGSFYTLLPEAPSRSDSGVPLQTTALPGLLSQAAGCGWSASIIVAKSRSSPLSALKLLDYTDNESTFPFSGSYRGE